VRKKTNQEALLVWGGILMMIRVQYENGSYDMVKKYLLDEGIKSGNVLKFRRKDGWAIVGIDSMRRSGYRYNVPERRIAA
jgi:hypothetical protein